VPAGRLGGRGRGTFDGRTEFVRHCLIAPTGRFAPVIIR